MIDPRLLRRKRNTPVQHYVVYDAEETYVFEGTIKEVSKYVKCKKDSIYGSFWLHGGEYAKLYGYTIYKTEKY